MGFCSPQLLPDQIGIFTGVCSIWQIDMIWMLSSMVDIMASIFLGLLKMVFAMDFDNPMINSSVRSSLRYDAAL